MADILPTTFVDSKEAISELVDELIRAPIDPPSLYLDLEGVNLSRKGTLSIITILLKANTDHKHAYLIDVHTLGRLAFETPGKDDKTVKEVLESPDIPKVFFDVRNDSDALYAHFKISLQGVQDVQLMENASRTSGSKVFLNGLAKCICDDAGLDSGVQESWQDIKEKVGDLFKSDEEGSSKVFNTRPMSADIQAYCVGDVQYLPRLRDLYWGDLSTSWKERVMNETRNRVSMSQTPEYKPDGEEKKFGPWPI